MLILLVKKEEKLHRILSWREFPLESKSALISVLWARADIIQSRAGPCCLLWWNLPWHLDQGCTSKYSHLCVSLRNKSTLIFAHFLNVY